jgi:inactivated superfamily I helicase
MSVQLILDDDGSIPIPLDESVQEAWQLQFERAIHAGTASGLMERLANCFANGLVECLDSDLKPPTEAQVLYATAITRELGLSLNAEALRYRGAMSEFINRYADAFKDRRRRRVNLDQS